MRRRCWMSLPKDDKQQENKQQKNKKHYEEQQKNKQRETNKQDDKQQKIEEAKIPEITSGGNVKSKTNLRTRAQKINAQRQLQSVLRTKRGINACESLPLNWIQILLKKNFD